MIEHLDRAIPAIRPPRDAARDSGDGAAPDATRLGLSRRQLRAFLLTIAVIELAWFACLAYGLVLLVSLVI